MTQLTREGSSLTKATGRSLAGPHPDQRSE